MIITEDSPRTLTCELTPTEFEAWNKYDQRNYEDPNPGQRPLKWRAVRTAEARNCTLLFIFGPHGEELTVATRMDSGSTYYWQWGRHGDGLSGTALRWVHERYGIK